MAARSSPSLRVFAWTLFAAAGCNTLAGFEGYSFDRTDASAAGGAGEDSGTAGTGGVAGAGGVPGDGGAAGTAGQAATGGASGEGGQAGSSAGGAGGAAGAGGQGGSAGAGQGGAAGAGGQGGSAGQGGAPAACAEAGGGAMVVLPAGYCIDAAEVTRDHYAAWLGTGPAAAGQPAWCTWNTSFAPDSSCTDWLKPCEAGNCGNRPQVCVDWCDAYAFCAAHGKRLCGKAGGGPNGYDDNNNASRSQWYNACVSGGAQNAYPYGSTYDANRCNGQDSGTGDLVEAGSLTTCQSQVSGYTGVFDLSGNVDEWEDSCAQSVGEGDSCRLRGGNYKDDSTGVACEASPVASRKYASTTTGFRCCSDP